MLDPKVISLYSKWVIEFGIAWAALGWKTNPWVHWLVVHSTALVKKHLTLRLFCSIPSEYRHHQFKLDIQHSFLGTN